MDENPSEPGVRLGVTRPRRTFEDLVGSGCPLERFRVLVVGCEVGVDCVGQVGDAVEDPAGSRCAPTTIS
jgi:hypothetical protein